MPTFTRKSDPQLLQDGGISRAFAFYNGDASLAGSALVGPLPIPSGIEIVDMFVESTGVDTNASAAATLSVVTGADTVNAIGISAVTVGNSGAYARANINQATSNASNVILTGTGLKFSRADSLTGGTAADLYVKVANAATSAGSAPEVKLTVLYTMDKTA